MILPTVHKVNIPHHAPPAQPVTSLTTPTKYLAPRFTWGFPWPAFSHKKVQKAQNLFSLQSTVKRFLVNIYDVLRYRIKAGHKVLGVNFSLLFQFWYLIFHPHSGFALRSNRPQHVAADIFYGDFYLSRQSSTPVLLPLYHAGD